MNDKLTQLEDRALVLRDSVDFALDMGKVDKNALPRFTELQDRVLVLRDSVDFAVDMAKEFDESKHPRDKEGKWRVVGSAGQLIGRMVSSGKEVASWVNRNKGMLAEEAVVAGIRKAIMLASGGGTDPHMTEEGIRHHVKHFGDNAGMAAHVAARRLRQGVEMLRRRRREQIAKPDEDVEKAKTDSGDGIINFFDDLIAILRRIEKEEEDKVEKWNPHQPRDERGRWVGITRATHENLKRVVQRSPKTTAKHILSTALAGATAGLLSPAVQSAAAAGITNVLSASAFGGGFAASAAVHAAKPIAMSLLRYAALGGAAGGVGSLALLGGTLAIGYGALGVRKLRDALHARRQEQPKKKIRKAEEDELLAQIKALSPAEADAVSERLLVSLTEEEGKRVMALMQGKEIEKFDPDQPRDAEGQWTDTGAGEKTSPKVERLKNKLLALHDILEETDPSDTKKVRSLKREIKTIERQLKNGSFGVRRALKIGAGVALGGAALAGLGIGAAHAVTRNMAAQARLPSPEWSQPRPLPVPQPSIVDLARMGLQAYGAVTGTRPAAPATLARSAALEEMYRQGRLIRPRPRRTTSGVPRIPLRKRAITAALAKEFKESEHPRDEEGKWTEIGRGAATGARRGLKLGGTVGALSAGIGGALAGGAVAGPAGAIGGGLAGALGGAFAGGTEGAAAGATLGALIAALRRKKKKKPEDVKLLAELERAKAKVEKKFDPDQPRDEDGKWTDVGGGKRIPKDIPRFKNAVQARLWLNQHLGEDLADLAELENAAAAMAAADTKAKRTKLRESLKIVNRAVKLATDAQKEHARKALQGAGSNKEKLKNAAKIAGAVLLGAAPLLLTLAAGRMASRGAGGLASARAVGEGSDIHSIKYTQALEAQRKLKLTRAAEAVARAKELKRRMKRSGLTVVKRDDTPDINALVASVIDQLSEAEAKQIVNAILHKSRIAAALAKFDPNQARDEEGKWTDTGGGKGAVQRPFSQQSAWRKWTRRALKTAAVVGGVALVLGGTGYLAHRELLNSAGRELTSHGVHPSMLKLDYKMATKTIAGQSLKRLGNYDPRTGKMTVWPLNILRTPPSQATIQSVLAHEAGHARFVRWAQGDKANMRWLNDNMRKLISESGGISNYADIYWDEAMKAPKEKVQQAIYLAVNESIAEMTANKRRTGKMYPGPRRPMLDELHRRVMAHGVGRGFIML